MEMEAQWREQEVPKSPTEILTQGDAGNALWDARITVSELDVHGRPLIPFDRQGYRWDRTQPFVYEARLHRPETGPIGIMLRLGDLDAQYICSYNQEPDFRRLFRTMFGEEPDALIYPMHAQRAAAYRALMGCAADAA